MTRLAAPFVASDQKGKSRLSSALFSGGLYLAVGATCVSNLRITPRGPALMLEGGGYPFLYELGIFVVLFATGVKLLRTRPTLTTKQQRALMGLALFYVPIFANYFFKSLDIHQLIGGGQLRLQLEAWLLGMALLVYPIDQRTVRRALTITTILAVMNAAYAITSYYGLVDPLYARAVRADTGLRYSGFLNQPSRTGVLSAMAIAWALWLSPHRLVTAIVILISGGGLVVSDSRTGMVAGVVVITAWLVSHLQIRDTLKLSILCFCLAALLVGLATLPETTWTNTRPVSIRAAFDIWLAHPLGIAWGTYRPVRVYATQVHSPHNWPAATLVYGGILSFLAVIAAHMWVFRLWWSTCQKDPHHVNRLQGALVFTLVAVTVASWFEQVLMHDSAILVYMIALAGLAHSYTNLCRKGDYRIQSVSRVSFRSVA